MTLPGMEDEALEVLRSVKGWPVDDTLDREFMATWRKLYPNLDMLEEATAWKAWMSEHEQKKRIKHRARFQNWLRNAEQYRVQRRTRRTAGTDRRPETEGHGDSVSSRRRW